MEERVKDILSKVAAKCGIMNWNYKTGDLNETIENYGGFLIHVTLIGASNERKLARNVILKLPSLNKLVCSFTDYWWDAEAYVYETLVPIWKSLTNLEIDELIPQCYFADTTRKNQALVLKDMRYEGYQNYQERFLDFDHVEVSLKALAEFHALSIIMKNYNKKLDAYALRPYTHNYPPELNRHLQETFRNHSQLFKGSKYEDFFEETLKNYESIVMESNSKAKCLVYGHGDYWKGNIMYKYQNKKPMKACILDFQCCRVLSPARDFLFFILNSTNSSQRRIHYTQFYNYYYSSLKSTLADNGIEIEKFYSREDFSSDLRIVSSICLLHVCMSFSLWLGFDSDTVIKSTIAWESELQRVKALQQFKKLLEDAVQDLQDYGYITV